MGAKKCVLKSQQASTTEKIFKLATETTVCTWDTLKLETLTYAETSYSGAKNKLNTCPLSLTFWLF